MDEIKEYARVGLQAELERLNAQREHILTLLRQLDTAAPARPGGKVAKKTRTRKMSAEGRKRIQEAVKRRWARVKAAQTGVSENVDVHAATAGEAVQAEPVRQTKRSKPKAATGNRKK